MVIIWKNNGSITFFLGASALSACRLGKKHVLCKKKEYENGSRR
jgi:hypothetical protein